MSAATLRLQLKALIADVDNQVRAIRAEFPDADIYRLRDVNGQFILAPLLAAKASALQALASLMLVKP